MITNLVKGATILVGRSQCGACAMQVWLAAICPKTLIVTLGDVLESDNPKKNCVSLDSVALGAESYRQSYVHISVMHILASCVGVHVQNPCTAIQDQ